MLVKRFPTLLVISPCSTFVVSLKNTFNDNKKNDNKKLMRKQLGLSSFEASSIISSRIMPLCL